MMVATQDYKDEALPGHLPHAPRSRSHLEQPVPEGFVPPQLPLVAGVLAYELMHHCAQLPCAHPSGGIALELGEQQRHASRGKCSCHRGARPPAEASARDVSRPHAPARRNTENALSPVARAPQPVAVRVPVANAKDRGMLSGELDLVAPTLIAGRRHEDHALPCRLCQRPPHHAATVIRGEVAPRHRDHRRTLPHTPLDCTRRVRVTRCRLVQRLLTQRLGDHERCLGCNTHHVPVQCRADLPGAMRAVASVVGHARLSQRREVLRGTHLACKRGVDEVAAGVDHCHDDPVAAQPLFPYERVELHVCPRLRVADSMSELPLLNGLGPFACSVSVVCDNPILVLVNLTEAKLTGQNRRCIHKRNTNRPVRGGRGEQRGKQRCRRFAERSDELLQLPLALRTLEATRQIMEQCLQPGVVAAVDKIGRLLEQQAQGVDAGILRLFPRNEACLYGHRCTVELEPRLCDCGARRLHNLFPHFGRLGDTG
mmetsp:Transcript_36240/g.84691  ORF Transcript_36240/g.84691 Transcript_36240/m.84691 type:complete len:485 (-) Transcript_36240:37-1491(-)